MPDASGGEEITFPGFHSITYDTHRRLPYMRQSDEDITAV